MPKYDVEIHYSGEIEADDEDSAVGEALDEAGNFATATLIDENDGEGDEEEGDDEDGDAEV